jgi:poly(A) polymerase
MRKLPRIRSTWLRDPRLQLLLKALEMAGGEARVAGGAVRNAILRQPVSDIDVATTLVPGDVARICKNAGFAVHPTGIEHGTLTVVVQTLIVEVTTLRKDVETDGRRAVVAFTTDWATDAARRDFTMNALYCDRAGKIYDFTDGYADCQKHRVKFVGSPARRIAEDALRILRFFRFHAQYGSGTIDKTGLAACVRSRKMIKTLSAERIRVELLKLLVAPGAVAVLKTMIASKILSEILSHHTDLRMISRLPLDPLIRLAALSAQPDALKTLLRLSNDEAQRIKRIVEAPFVSPTLKPKEQLRLLYQLRPETWRDAVAQSFAHSYDKVMTAAWKKLSSLPDRIAVPVFPVTGHDLIALGLAPGPTLGQMMQKLEDWWVASDFKPTKEELLARARTA